MNLVITQALATGLPVITTKHSGLPDQVKEGQNGFLVPERDYKALAEKIIYMIEHPEILVEFGKHGREHVAKNYDSKLLIENQIQFYNQVIDESDNQR